MTTGTPPPGAPAYEGSQVQLGGGRGGMKPLAQSGKVLIVDGQLILYGTKGQVIDRAPVATVSAKKTWYTMNSVIIVRLGGDRKYSPRDQGRRGDALRWPGSPDHRQQCGQAFPRGPESGTTAVRRPGLTRPFGRA